MSTLAWTCLFQGAKYRHAHASVSMAPNLSIKVHRDTSVNVSFSSWAPCPRHFGSVDVLTKGVSRAPSGGTRSNKR